MSDAAQRPGRLFTKTELLGFFAELDVELPRGEHVQIAAIGGAAVMFLMEGFPIRMTDDVDVISEGMPKALEEAAARVSRRHGLRLDWINDAAKGGLPHLNPDVEPIFVGERLVVYRASLQYVLATKLQAGRPIDVSDATDLAIVGGITAEEDLLDLAEAAYPGPWQTPRLSLTAQTVAALVAERLQQGVDHPTSTGSEPEVGGLDQ